jgi:hypothetical protein
MQWHQAAVWRPAKLAPAADAVPAPGPPQVGLGVAGGLNVSAHWEAQLGGSAPAVQPSAYSYDLEGRAYMLQVHPLVEAVRPSSGAIQGGCCSSGRRAGGVGWLHSSARQGLASGLVVPVQA